MVKSAFSKSVMLSFVCIFLFCQLCALYNCSFCVTGLMYLCIVALSLFQQTFVAPRLDSFRDFSASWLRVHSSSVCFRVAVLYRNR